MEQCKPRALCISSVCCVLAASRVRAWLTQLGKQTLCDFGVASALNRVARLHVCGAERERAKYNFYWAVCAAWRNRWNARKRYLSCEWFLCKTSGTPTDMVCPPPRLWSRALPSRTRWGGLHSHTVGMLILQLYDSREKGATRDDKCNMTW